MNLIKVIGYDKQTISNLKRLEEYKENSKIDWNKRIKEHGKKTNMHNGKVR